MLQAYLNDEKAILYRRATCQRWHCCTMTLWRLRARGVLPPPIKIGGGKNLTPAEAVKRLEQPPINDLSNEKAAIMDAAWKGICMSEAKSKTAAEVLPDQGSGEVTEESLPLFPTPTAAPAQDVCEEDEDWKFDWLNDPSVILRDHEMVPPVLEPWERRPLHAASHYR